MWSLRDGHQRKEWQVHSNNLEIGTNAPPGVLPLDPPRHLSLGQFLLFAIKGFPLQPFLEPSRWLLALSKYLNRQSKQRGVELSI